MTRTPRMVRCGPPMPPERAVPPMTMAAMESSSMLAPAAGVPAPTCAVSSTPAMPHSAPDSMKA